MEYKDLLHDVFLLDFWDKKNNHASLIGIKEIEKLYVKYEYIRNDTIRSIPYIQSVYKMHTHDFKYNIKDMLSRSHPLINDLLKIGRGYMSLCGKAALILLRGFDNIDNFELYFHCDSENKISIINDIVIKCLYHIKLSYNKRTFKVIYERSQCVQTINIQSIGPFGCNYKIHFINRIYDTSNQIFFDFDLDCNKFGYNHEKGLFATHGGAISFAVNICPINTKERSFSYRNNLIEYNNHFNISLSGISINNNIDQLITPDGIITFDNTDITIKKGKIDTNKIILPNGQNIDIKTVNRNNIETPIIIEQTSDYNSGICVPEYNWLLLKENNLCVTFSSHIVEDMYELPDSVINTGDSFYDKYILDFNTFHKLQPCIAKNR